MLNWVFYNVLNTSFFIGFSTLMTGAIALLVYVSKNRAEKRRAAKTLLLEIRKAEDSIDRIKRGKDPDGSNFQFDQSMMKNESVLPQSSWQKFSHFFMDDLDRDELKQVNDFFNKAELIHGYVNELGKFGDNQVREAGFHAQKIHIDFIKEYLDEMDDGGEIDLKPLVRKQNSFWKSVKKAQSLSGHTLSMGRVEKNLSSILDNFTNISDSVAGVKIKKAGKKQFWNKW